jgi:hypothetical protein
MYVAALHNFGTMITLICQCMNMRMPENLHLLHTGKRRLSVFVMLACKTGQNLKKWQKKRRGTKSVKW